MSAGRKLKRKNVVGPAMEIVEEAVEKKDSALFGSGYVLLTNSCNTCHKTTEVPFVVVKIPINTAFTQQDCRPQVQEGRLSDASTARPV